ncbi:dihydrolipoamide acetyltransferase family protein [Tenggerimyces flavus]|uniref:Dihydrolipoamide acetyltransferase component of pyruvate dehydrogenase complex n=1 Tax=Tenggerimyces flavus TaxID=1708749 RepID=A0ABV7YK80_9ACTN|nr:dihydrolipoamide acetyltransferase family protein [Tenggerimyces flavus]MBM7789626.1 pyruvate/2-oxoglutarate dehydrogenase complex dihydrolipoamide acyltransferase (E2) component [Tenggerimyces flavus]
MTYEVVMPAMEMDQESATLLQWLRSVGSEVAEGDPLMEIETDKVTVEIEAPVSGVLDSVSAQAGDVVPVGRVVATIRPTGAVTTPAASAVAEPQAAVPLSPMQARVAERVQRSYTEAPHIALRRTIDASRLLERQRELRASQPATVLCFILEACAATLVEHPLLNAHYTDGRVTLWPDVHLGVAISADDGLFVPVVRQAQLKSPAALANEVADLADRARTSALTPAALRGSTFTISNLGKYTVDDFTAILNPPEVAILTVGRIEQHPWVAADGALVVAPVLTFTLCVDHRVVNGAAAAAFLTDLARRLESPRNRGSA